MTAMAPAADGSYPVRLEIQYAESPSRLTFVKWLLAIPMLIFGQRVNMSGWNGGEFRRVLLPITFGTDVGIQLRFACRLVRRNHDA